MRFLFLVLTAISFCGCGSLPNATALTRSRFFYRQPKFVTTTGRPLSTAEGKAIVAALEQRTGKTDILRRHLAFEQAITGVPLSLGNSAILLKDGPETYKAMFDAMEGAQDSINLETYIFSDDEIGLKFADTLKAKQRAGVQVNVIYDSFGSRQTPRNLFDDMMMEGVKIYITDAYFAPGHEMLEALEGAARRGVDVRLLLPGRVDEPLMALATRSYYSELLGAGVQIYEWQGKMVHAKTATIDNVWSTVGSSNLDWWSIARNNEINAVILSYKFAQEVELMFYNDLERSDRIDPIEWPHRPTTERTQELFGRMIEPIL